MGQKDMNAGFLQMRKAVAIELMHLGLRMIVFSICKPFLNRGMSIKKWNELLHPETSGFEPCKRGQCEVSVENLKAFAVTHATEGVTNAEILHKGNPVNK